MPNGDELMSAQVSLPKLWYIFQWNSVM